MQTFFINTTGNPYYWVRFASWLTFLFISVVSHSQDLEYTSQKTIVLKDGTSITLYAQVNDNGRTAVAGKNYYYLPPEVMLSKNPQSQVPQFLFLKYLTENREDQGGVSGGLLHFLVQWGIKPSQLEELKAKLSSDIPGAMVQGPVKLFATEGDSYVITSATVNEKSGMTKSVVASGTAPLLQGDKLAVACNLNSTGAQLLAATFEKTKSVTDLTVTLKYNYHVKLSGLKAKITIDYQKMADVVNKDLTVSKKDWDYSVDGTRATWDEMHSFIKKLEEKQAVNVKIDQGISNAVSDKLTEIIFQILLAKLTAPAPDTSSVQPPAPVDGKDPPYRGPNRATRYTLSLSTAQKCKQKKTEVMTIDYTYTLPLPAQVTGNLASWYNSVKDNKNCIASVNLNDPFYKHLDIRFVLDVEAKEMFDQEINYVTINILKKRKSGNDFTGRITFDKKFVTENGITAAVTYAAGEDKSPDMYQYMAQWSLRGGNIYPKNPTWENGRMEAVQLKPPVIVRNIEFESDLEKLKEAGISRVTLQVRYKKFDEEVEDNINISVAKNEALVNKNLFMDRDTRGYVYRLVFNHTKDGKLATAWSAKINDNYVYATLPEEFNDKTSEQFNKAVDAAKTISTTAADGKVSSDKVLDGFKDVLGAAKQ